jgi:hypothetical protein
MSASKETTYLSVADDDGRKSSHQFPMCTSALGCACMRHRQDPLRNRLDVSQFFCRKRIDRAGEVRNRARQLGPANAVPVLVSPLEYRVGVNSVFACNAHNRRCPTNVASDNVALLLGRMVNPVRRGTCGNLIVSLTRPSSVAGEGWLTSHQTFQRVFISHADRFVILFPRVESDDRLNETRESEGWSS